MYTSDFDYELPPEKIAQIPVEPRHNSRLMVVDRERGTFVHTIFKQIGPFLEPGDLLVLNETKVIPARLFAKKIPSGGKFEILLLNKQEDRIWEVLVGGGGVTVGKRFQVIDGPQGEVRTLLTGGRRLVEFDETIEPQLTIAGHVPLPPYIHQPLANPDRYQTVYARQPGSAAAPTAGLHFTPQLLASLQTQGVGITTVTLHIGLDTFAPVTEADPHQHAIHTEWCQLSTEAVKAINNAKQAGKRVIAVGTTSVRTLEWAANQTPNGEILTPYEGPTNLFILPGYRFRLIDAMITNFHLPRSTLIMLVSAFAGRETILHAYQIAINEGYRFYSFGDAMLIL